MGIPEKETVDIVRELKQGINRDENFRLLDSRYRGRLEKFFLNREYLKENYKDLTQEVVSYAFKHLDELREDERFEPWLFKIARNTYNTAVRYVKAGKRSADQDQWEGDLSDSGEIPDNRAEDNPHEALLKKERQQLLREAIKELPLQMRRCLHLRLQDVPISEIARIMQITEGAVKAHLNQAKQILKRKLGPHSYQNVDTLDLENS